MTEKLAKPPAAKVRPATANDFSAVYPMLQELNNTRFTREIWQRLFTNLWGQSDWCPGYVLDTGDEIVGFLGGVYSADEYSGMKVCNLTAWIVKDEYRSSSIMLLMPFLRQKDTILTSLTSSPEAYKVYKKLGFKDLDSSARVLYPVPSLKRAYGLVTSEEKISELLSGQDKKSFDDHKELDVWQVVIQKGSEICYLMGTRRLGRGHIQKVGNIELFRESIAAVSRKICKEIEVKSLQVDERYLDGKKINFSRKKAFSQPKQVKGKVDYSKVDGAYSELVILATP